MRTTFLLIIAFALCVSTQALNEELLHDLEDTIEDQQEEMILRSLLKKLEGNSEGIDVRSDGSDEERRAYLEDMEHVDDENNGNPAGFDDTFDKKQELPLTEYEGISKLIKAKPLPVKPLRPIPKNPYTCCNKGTTTVDLDNGDVCSFDNSAVQIYSKPAKQSYGNKKCSMAAVVKINFEKITKTPCELVDGCLYGPYCGRRMLRIDLELSSNGHGWMFNVGDSQSNNGWKGDSNHQQNDAEVDGKFPHINAWGSDYCPSKTPIVSYTNALANSVSRVTMFVSDKHIRITNDAGLDETLCHKCMYALNGQADSGPNSGPNQDIYVGLNRVVLGGRTGYGVCSAKFSWMCPW